MTTKRTKSENARTTVDISKSLFKKVKIYCAENDISIKDFLISAIEEKLGK